MNKMMTLAAFGVAAVFVVAAVTLAAPPAEAWDATDVCEVWYSTTQNGPAAEVASNVVFAADGADLGCFGAIQECWSQGLYFIYTDPSFSQNC